MENTIKRVGSISNALGLARGIDLASVLVNKE